MLGDGALLYTTRHAPSSASSGGFVVLCSSSRHLASTAAAIFAGTNNAGAPKGASSRFTSACSASAAGVATGAALKGANRSLLVWQPGASKAVATGRARRWDRRMAWQQKHKESFWLVLSEGASDARFLLDCCTIAREHTPWHKCCQTSRLQPADPGQKCQLA